MMKFPSWFLGRRPGGVVAFCGGLLGMCLVAGLAFSSVPDPSKPLQRPSETFLEGVKAYENGEYSLAAEHFEALVKCGVHNGKLYYNLGNAYLKQRELGLAILWYERARSLLGTSDPELQFNLEYARGLTVDSVDADGVDWTGILLFWRDLVPRRMLATAGLTFYVVFWGLLCVRYWKRVRAIRGLACGIGILAGLLLLTTFFGQYASSIGKRAIVLPAEVSIRSGTSPDTTELFRLHAGALVRVDREQGEYLRVQFGEKGIGWLPAETVGRVMIPPSESAPPKLR